MKTSLVWPAKWLINWYRDTNSIRIFVGVECCQGITLFPTSFHFVAFTLCWGCVDDAVVHMLATLVRHLGRRWEAASAHWRAGGRTDGRPDGLPSCSPLLSSPIRHPSLHGWQSQFSTTRNNDAIDHLARTAGRPADAACTLLPPPPPGHYLCAAAFSLLGSFHRNRRRMLNHPLITHSLILDTRNPFFLHVNCTNYTKVSYASLYSECHRCLSVYIYSACLYRSEVGSIELTSLFVTLVGMTSDKARERNSSSRTSSPPHFYRFTLS